MKQYLLILSFISIGWLMGCLTREDDLISQNCIADCKFIEGRITTSQGADPLHGAKLILYWTTHDYMAGIVRKKASVFTNEQGFYSVSFIQRDDETVSGYYYFDVKTPEEFLTCNNTNSITIDRNMKDTTNLFNFNVPYKAYINLNVGSLDSFEDSDMVYVSTFSSFGSSDCYHSVYWRQDNLANYQKLEVASQEELILELRHFKDNKLYKLKRDTLVLSPLEVRDYEVTIQ